MKNEEIIKNMVQEVWNNHNPDLVEKYFSDKLLVHNPYGKISSLPQFKNFVKDMCRAFPDINFTIEDILAVDNKVVIRWSGKGTHKRDLERKETADKRLSYEGITIYQLENGKINEYWISVDMQMLLEFIAA